MLGLGLFWAGFGSRGSTGEGAAELLSGPDHAADTAQSILLIVKKCRGHRWICLATSQCWSLGDSNRDLFHAIDGRPMWWTGPEAGDWSPASAVDRHCASGLLSSLVISLVVRRSTGWGHTGGQSGFDCSCWSRPRRFRRASGEHGVACGYAYDPLDDYAGAELVDGSPDPQPPAGWDRTCFRPTRSWPAGSPMSRKGQRLLRVSRLPSQTPRHRHPWASETS